MIVSESERVTAVSRQIAIAKRELAYLDGQLREARMRTPGLLGRATPGQHDRIRQEVADLQADRARCQERLDRLEAELTTATAE